MIPEEGHHRPPTTARLDRCNRKDANPGQTEWEMVPHWVRCQEMVLRDYPGMEMLGEHATVCMTTPSLVLAVSILCGS